MELLLGPIAAWLVQAGPWIVFLVTMTETAVFLGLLVPAEATVLLAAFLAEQGHFSVWAVLWATILGGFTGDQLGYALGRWGVRFSRQGDGMEQTREHYEGLTVRLLRRHSLVGISLARFLSFIRTLMPWFAGRNRVPYGRFVLFDAIGVLGWGVGSVALGYAAGASWHVVAGTVGTVGGIIVAALAVALLLAARRQGRLRFPGLRRRVLGPEPAGPTTAAEAEGAGSDAARLAEAAQAVFRVGLTGNIASGKSSVAAVWRRLGAIVVDADDLARRAVAPGTPGLRTVVDAFGPEVLTPSGELDRAALRRRVFTDEAARRRVEAIVHPEVARLRAAAEVEARAAHGADGTPVVVHDIPLLFEVGIEDEMDVVVLVDAPEPERLRRLVEIRGLDADEARRMMDAQQPADEKRLRADRVIDNDGSLEELERQAREVWDWIRERTP